VDPLYADAGASPAAARARRALAQLADFLHPEAVLETFPSAGDFVEAAHARPGAYACSLVVAQAPVGAAEDAAAARRHAGALLSRRGLFASLEDVGDAARCRAARRCAPPDAEQRLIPPTADAVDQYWLEASLGSYIAEARARAKVRDRFRVSTSP